MIFIILYKEAVREVLNEERLEFFLKNISPNDEVMEEIKKVFKKTRGEVINIDLKKLEGSWVGY